MSAKVPIVTPASLPDPCPHGTMLYCPSCGGEWSATRGDYFMLRADHVFVCVDCPRRPRLRLVRKETRHVPVAVGA